MFAWNVLIIQINISAQIQLQHLFNKYQNVQFSTYNTVYDAQQMPFVDFEFTGAARGFVINSCVAQGINKMLDSIVI